MTALRKEAAEFEALVREGRKDSSEPLPETVDEKDNGNERLKRAIAHKKVPDFDAGLKKLADAKEARLKLQAECEAVKARIGLCLSNPIFDGIEENDEARGEQPLYDNWSTEMNMRAQLLLEDGVVDDSDDERAAAEYKDALEEVRQFDSQFLAHASDARAEEDLPVASPDRKSVV